MMTRMRIFFKKEHFKESKARSLIFYHRKLLFQEWDGEFSAVIMFPAGEFKYYRRALENDNLVARVEFLK